MRQSNVLRRLDVRVTQYLKPGLFGLCCFVAAVSACAADAQNFPTKPIRMIASSAGGAGDFTARLSAAGVTARLGQPRCATAMVAKPHVASGKLVGLAVTSGKRSALLPELPTIAESGLPGYESASTLGAFAPAATPPAIVRLLN